MGTQVEELCSADTYTLTALPGFIETTRRILGTRDALKSYSCPEWFRDVKSGMWVHRGPQLAHRN
jgi:hypothetical protein